MCSRVYLIIRTGRTISTNRHAIQQTSSVRPEQYYADFVQANAVEQSAGTTQLATDDCPTAPTPVDSGRNHRTGGPEQSPSRSSDHSGPDSSDWFLPDVLSSVRHLGQYLTEGSTKQALFQKKELRALLCRFSTK